MSSLSDTDKRYLEKILGMGSGYVLDYTNAKFRELFQSHGIEIESEVYKEFGTSKANRMRSFWAKRSDEEVGNVLTEMLDGYEADCLINGKTPESKLLDNSRQIVLRLLGSPGAIESNSLEDEFLKREFETPEISRLPIDPDTILIFESRIEEARRAMGAKAYLSVIFLCGSVLEGALLGTAQRNAVMFNKANSSPKDKHGRVKKFPHWTLSELINTASELKLILPDVQKFSHGLRNFRNYIHPYEQVSSGFTPDKHTAKVCFHVLKAALASLAGER